MREIDSVTISATEDRRLVLSNATVARVMNVGSWTSLRVGIRFCFDDNLLGVGGVQYGPPRFYFGLLASPSTTNGPQGVLTSHFVGFRTNAQFNRNTSPVTFYSTSTSGIQLLSKVLDTTPQIASHNSSHNLSATPSANIWVLFIHFTKAGGGTPVNWTLEATHYNQAPVNDTVSKEELLTAMATADAAACRTYMNTILSGNPYNNLSSTFSVDEGVNGTLNAVCVAWDRNIPKMRISDIMYRKLS